MELEEGTLNENSVLSMYDEWDSLSIIPYIALMATRFKKNISMWAGTRKKSGKIQYKELTKHYA